ncbi:MAG: hypothetical protein AAF597_02085 [Bacteroidota bacterium]
MRPAILTFFALFLFISCSVKRDIRDYYFPVRELINTDGLVYAYENTGTLPGPDREYWYYLGVDQDTALYLSVTRYSPEFSPEQQSREKITNDGVILQELTMLPTDSNGVAQPVTTDIIYDKVFPFYLKQGDPIPYGYRMKFNSLEAEGATSYVTFNRRYRADTVINLMGKEYDAIIFDLEGEVSMRDPEAGDISPTFGGYEIFARGLGRVEFKRELGDGASFGGRLVERIPMMEFTERIR